MQICEVTEYDHFVSFVVEHDQGARTLVQYREGQVWKDDNGVWQIRDDQKPYYVCHVPSKPRKVASAALVQAIEQASQGIGGDRGTRKLQQQMTVEIEPPLTIR